MCTPDLAKSFSDYLKRLGRRAFGAERAVGTKAFRDENKNTSKRTHGSREQSKG